MNSHANYVHARVAAPAAAIIGALLWLGGCTSSQPDGKSAPSDLVVSVAQAPSMHWGLEHSRKDFANKFAKIKEGMPAAKVLTLLGKPDDVQTQYDPGGINLTGTREIWNYGTDSHMGFATLGSVVLDEQYNVQYYSGSHGADKLVAKLGEAELQRLLRLIDAAGCDRLTSEEFDPAPAIVAINALQPLGKELGVTAMREYMDVNIRHKFSEDEGLFVVMRVLFEVPPATSSAAVQPQAYPRVVNPGYFGPPALGAPNWHPDDETQCPRFPVALVGDVPIIVVRGYAGAGRPEMPNQHLDELERDAQWRLTPLRPTDDPIGLAIKFPRIDKMQLSDTEIRLQFLRLMSTAYRIPKNEDEIRLTQKDIAANFTTISEQVRAHGIHWDERQSAYVRGDGTRLPDEVKPFYRRNIFEPTIGTDKNYGTRVVLERLNSKRIKVEITVVDHTGSEPKADVKIKSSGQPLAVPFNESLRMDESSSHSSTIISGGYVMLPAGERVTVEVTQNGQTFVSPEFQP